MRITKISVEELFYTYTYTIELKGENPVSIIHAPNGYGKTTVFKLIRDLFDLNIQGLCEVPFKSFSIELSDGHEIKIENSELCEINQDDVKMVISINPGKSIYHFTQDFITFLSEVRFRRYPKERIEKITVDNTGDLISEIQEIRKNMKIHFIETNRLYSNYNPSYSGIISLVDSNFDNLFEDAQKRRNLASSIELNEIIVQCANDLKNKINQVKQEYSSYSEQLDRSFPKRLVDSVNNKEEFYDNLTIEKKLKELDKKRKELEGTGILSGESNSTPLPTVNSSDETLNRFYTLYIDDTFAKLSHYDYIKDKIEQFFSIINNKTKFSNKKLDINSDGKVYFKPIGKTLNPNNEIELKKLSSGEKHDFILFYELIFNSDEKSVFLIDEPEISLHVAWQVEYVKILEDICNRNGMQSIIATHSPDIVNGRNDLLISLGYEVEDYE